MFSKEDSTNRNPGDIQSILGRGMSFKGNAELSGSIRLEASFEGNMICKGQVLVTVEGRFSGDMVAQQVVIAGRAQGSIKAQDVRLLKGSHVEADVETKKLLIEEGSFFDGRSQMTGGEGAASPAPLRVVDADRRR